MPGQYPLCYSRHTSAHLHWLRAAQYIQLKLAALTFCCLDVTILGYLSASFHRVAEVHSRRRQRSTATDCERAFPVTAAKLWNKRSVNVTTSQSLTALRYQLESGFFSNS